MYEGSTLNQGATFVYQTPSKYHSKRYQRPDNL